MLIGYFKMQRRNAVICRYVTADLEDKTKGVTRLTRSSVKNLLAIFANEEAVEKVNKGLKKVDEHKPDASERIISILKEHDVAHVVRGVSLRPSRFEVLSNIMLHPDDLSDCVIMGG